MLSAWRTLSSVIACFSASLPNLEAFATHEGLPLEDIVVVPFVEEPPTLTADSRLDTGIVPMGDVPKFEDDQDCPGLRPELCGLWVGGLAVTSLPASLYVTQGTSPITLGLPTPPTTARTFVEGDVLTITADVATPRGFRHGSMRLTVHEETASPDDPPLWYDANVLEDRGAAHTLRPWRLDTSALGAGTFVLRLRVFDHRDRWAETSMPFEVVPAPAGAGR